MLGTYEAGTLVYRPTGPGIKEPTGWVRPVAIPGSYQYLPVGTWGNSSLVPLPAW
jgi:hypothetical protein